MPIVEEQKYRQFDNMEVNLLVHEFTRSGESRQRPKQLLLNHGFRLVAAALTGDVVRGQPTNFGSVHENVGVNSFTYNKQPPIVPATRTVVLVKEWGSSIDDDEIFTIDGLEEFQMTKPIQIEEERPNGQDIDIVSLHEIIPLPHLHPSPFLNKDPPPKGQPFNRNLPIFVGSYFDLSSIQDHARVAWLIPIRGIFPWSGCTRALLFTVSMPSSVEDDLICWNRASLLQFWQFLLDLRKSGSLGALGISLHAARSSKLNSNNPRRPMITDVIPQPVEHRQRCSAVDYFKIYHDASRLFYVRKAIDSWSYKPGPDSDKVRMLKGAKFPLLDEVSTGILVC